MISKHLIPVLITMLMVAPVMAGEQQELLMLKNTTLNLIEALVKDGILSRERADALIAEAERSAADEVEQQEKKQAGGSPGVVRVPYVPEFVRQEIKDEVKAELRQEVVGDVMSQAKTERWGIPEALPDWTRRFKFSGDIRLRAQGDFYDSGNPEFTFVDFNEGEFINSTEDRSRGRIRMRLGVNAKVNDALTAGIRIVSGSFGNPVSTNATLGNDFGSYELVLDRAYLKYIDLDADRHPWMTLWGGRMPNPWFSTDLVWDEDLNFDGAAATFRYNLADSDSLYAMDERDRTVFLTIGAFSLDEVELSSRDKWLFAGQLGADLRFDDQSSFRIGLAYYNYYNVTGKPNTLNQPNKSDFTAPGFAQKGNSMFDISDPVNPLQTFGLVADYDLVNLTAAYDIARFAPVHVILTGDYVNNIGYDAGEIRNRLNGASMYVNNAFTPPGDPGDENTEGYMARLTVGWPDISMRRRWQVFVAYKYLERDAVLDAFTDSDFHLGGTNAKGWIVGGRYGLIDDTYLQVRYLSADEIEGPPLGIDVLQLDIGAAF